MYKIEIRAANTASGYGEAVRVDGREISVALGGTIALFPRYAAEEIVGWLGDSARAVSASAFDRRHGQQV